MTLPRIPARLRTGIAALSVVMLLALAPGLARQPARVHAQAGGAPIAFTVNDSAITGPDTVAPGTQTLNISNTGAMPHDLHIMRLNDGVTLEQLLAAAPQGNNPDPQSILAFYALAQQYGGADTMDPGMGQLLTADLAAGNYLAVDETGDQPILKPFTVTGPSAGIRTPQADVVVTEGEMYFDAPQSIKAGSNVVKVTNVGNQVHMLVLARIDSGHTVDDVIRGIAANTGGPPPDWVHPVPGMPDLSPGLTVYTTLTFDPGTYVLLCFEPDADTGRPHVALGMIGSFTAQ